MIYNRVTAFKLVQLHAEVVEFGNDECLSGFAFNKTRKGRKTCPLPDMNCNAIKQKDCKTKVILKIRGDAPYLCL